MKKLLLILLFPIIAYSQNKEIEAIKSIMQTQQNSWNEGSLVKFMVGYWESDSLKFIGKSGINYGWKKTLENYKKSYPTSEKMGKLTFTILEVDVLNKGNAHVIGKWHLTRAEGDLSGHFTLLWKKIKGKWVIVCDHSS